MSGPTLSRQRIDALLGGSCRIPPTRHDSPVGRMRIDKAPAHFHFDFVNENFAIPNLGLDVASFAKQRAKLTRAPSREARLIFALETMPCCARLLKTGHRRRTLAACGASQRLMVDPDDGVHCGVGVRPHRSFGSVRQPRHLTKLLGQVTDENAFR
ncbi:MAG: hypothetical protein H0X73_10740 [Chthoniobacterales bacterium]|nr:hypothetical protein [Chthoniobacterales bacterium]